MDHESAGNLYIDLKIFMLTIFQVITSVEKASK